jgi:hypothetical protein
LILLVSAAFAQASVAGYFRVMTRPDFVGGDGKLGYWNLYGRLLNEGPYGALELKLDLLERRAGALEPWTDLHIKVEGGSVQNADAINGSLTAFRLSQVYVRAGNLGLSNVVWRLGSLESTFGDLGLYDMRPASVLTDTIGISGTFGSPLLDVTLGVGDAGYALKGSRYNTVFSGGGTARLRLGKHLELGGGGQLWDEPSVAGNRNAPYATPGVSYEDYIRGEFLENYAEENPGAPEDIPDPEARSSLSYAAVGYLGFGGLGPLRWNNLFVRYQKLHPETWYYETTNGVEIPIYLHDLTDERTYFAVGDELQLKIIPNRLDLVAGGVMLVWQDGDNEIAPSSYDRSCWSGVGRLQTYLTPGLHLLIESSYAVEKSHNGNAFREHADSIFEGENGASNAEGLEYGDSDTRTTFQIKGGVVLSPLGPGIYTRPSLRILYGGQWSSQNNAFGNSFVETVDQYNTFGNIERHWHHLLALETEVWF